MKSYIFSGALACAMVAGSVSANESVDKGEKCIKFFLKRWRCSFHKRKKRAESCLFITAKNIQGETLRDALENFISPVGMLSDSEESDAVVILDESKNIPILKKIAEELDKPVEQVLVGARVVEIYMNEGYEKEIALSYQRFSKDITAADGFAEKLAGALVPSAPDDW